MKELQKILLVKGAFGDAYEPAWCRSLTELGKEVRLVDAHAYTLGGIAGRLERRVLIGPGIERVRRTVRDQVRQFQPDVILLYQGHYFDAPAVRDLSSFAPVVGYHNDDPFGPQTRMLRYRHLLDSMGEYSGYHVYRPVNIKEALARGARRVGLLMPYYLPWTDYPRKAADISASWRSDVIFAGHVEPDGRADLLSRAVTKGYAVKIHGEGRFWNKYLDRTVRERVGQIRQVFGDDYRLALSGAKIATCFFSKVNRDTYTRRVFEIPACGTFLLCERTEAMQEIYREGQEAEFFSSEEEFVDKVEYYLKNDGLREDIAAAGYRRVLRDGHDINARMKQWVADLSAWL